jgi:Flp pilus assembly protein TadG
MVNCLIRFLKAHHGMAAVELALLSPVLATMVIGIIDFGGAVYTAVQVEAAARAPAPNTAGPMRAPIQTMPAGQLRR